MSLTKVNADFMLTGRLSGQTISVDTTITTTAYIEQNNPVTISNGVTLSINGPFEAGLYQVFNCVGTGQVVFGNQVGVICPEWWATNTTPGTTNMQPALQAALTAAGQTNTTARTIKLNALYAVTDELVWSAGGYANNIHLQGVGSDKTGTYGTRIVWTGAVDATKTLIRVSENASFGRISNLQLDGASKIGFNLRFKAATDVQLGAPGWVFDRLVCENVTVANIVYGPYLDGGTYDVDAPDHIYYNLWLGDATLGLIIDAKNVQQLALYNPNFSLGDASVPISCVWQRNVESGPLLIVNPFINNMTNAHPATAMVQNSGGPLTIIGGACENTRLLYVNATGAPDRKISIRDHYSRGDTNQYAVYALTGDISLDNCIFGPDNGNAKIYSVGKLYTKNVQLTGYTSSTVGQYNGTNPTLRNVDGVYAGTLQSLSANPFFSWWQTSLGGGDYTAINWEKYNVAGTAVIAPDATNAVYGGFTAKVTVTVADATHCVGVQQSVSIGNQSGYVTIIMTGTHDGAVTPTININGSGAGDKLIQLGTNKFVVVAVVNTSGFSGQVTVQGGIAATQTGSLWIDTFSVYPMQLPFLENATILSYPKAESDSPLILQATAAPTLADGMAWPRGAILFRKDATTGSAMGWMCTVAGSPGTWNSMGNLA